MGDDDAKSVVTWSLELPRADLYPIIKTVWPSANSNQKLSFMKIFESRGASEMVPLLLKELTSNNDKVRMAAVQTVGKLDSSQSVKILTNSYSKTDSAKERSKILRIFVNICKKENDAKTLTTLMTSPQSIKEILPFLAAVGNKSALLKVVELTESDNATLKDAAIHTLFLWRSPVAIPQLLKVAQNTSELKYNVLAVKAIMKVAKMQKGMSGMKTLDKAYVAAKRKNERSSVSNARINLALSRKVKANLDGDGVKLIQKAYALANAAQKTKMKKKFGKYLK